MGIYQQYSKRRKKKLWGFDERIGKRRMRRFHFESKAEAEEVLAHLKLLHRADQYGMPRPRAAIHLNRLIDTLAAQNPTVPYERRIIAILRALSKLHPAITLQEMRTAHLRVLRQRLEEKGKKPSTVNYYLRMISAALHRAIELFPSLENWTPPKIPYIKNADTRRERIASGEETRLILAQLRDKPANPGGKGRKWDAALFPLVADLFELALLTVRRQGELLHIRRSDVMLDAGMLRTLDIKKKAHFLMPLSARAKEILAGRMMAVRKPNAYLFAGENGPTPQYAALLRRVLKCACERAGVPYGHRVDGGIVFHDLRHTAMTNLLQTGVDLATAQSLSRQSSRTIALRYGHATDRSQRAALAALESFGVQSVTTDTDNDTDDNDFDASEKEPHRLAG